MMRRLFAALAGFFSLITAYPQEITVDQVVQLAIKKNFDVQVLQKTSDIASNDNRYAFGAFLPALNITGSIVKPNNNTSNLSFLPGAQELNLTGVKSTNMQGSLGLVWTLFDGTKMFATRRRIEELAILGEANVRNQMMNSTALVITTYYNIIRQKELLKATQELMAVSEERVKLAEKKLQVGTGGKPELLQAKVDYNANRTAILAQLTLIQQLKDQLNGQLGMGLPDQYDVADTIPINLSITLEEIITDIESTNTTLIAARKNIDVANQVLRENRASRFPIINLTSAYNFNRTENEQQINNATQQYTQTWGFNYGASISIPIMNYMNVNRLVSQAKFNIERQKLIYDQQLMFAVVGVRNAYVNYDNAKKALLIEEENILLAKENVNIALEGFKRGITTFIELRTAQQSLADAYNRLIAARFLAKTSEIELLRLKGSLLR